MGRSIYQADGLEPPLDRVTERVMFIPRGRRLVVNNIQPKIVILLDGKVKALVNGRAVGELEEGDALVIPGACKQAYIPLGARREMRMHVLIAAFRLGAFAPDGALLRAAAMRRANGQASENFLFRHFGSVQIRRAVLTPGVMAWLEALRGEAGENRAGYRLRLSAYVLLLLTEIARQALPFSVIRTASMNRQAWMAEQVKNFLLEHHSEQLTLDQVAWHLRLSAEHLARIFRKQTKQTIFGYLQNLRIEQAKSQLAASQLAINEIARLTGFKSASQLCRVFKRTTGTSPLAYRLRLAKAAAFSPSTLEGRIV